MSRSDRSKLDKPGVSSPVINCRIMKSRIGCSSAPIRSSDVCGIMAIPSHSDFIESGCDLSCKLNSLKHSTRCFWTKLS